MAEPKFDGQFSFKLSLREQETFIARAEAAGYTKDRVLRELVQAFNAATEGNVRLVLPLAIASPRYQVRGNLVINVGPAAPAAEPETPEAAMAAAGAGVNEYPSDEYKGMTPKQHALAIGRRVAKAKATQAVAARAAR